MHTNSIHIARFPADCQSVVGVELLLRNRLRSCDVTVLLVVFCFVLFFRSLWTHSLASWYFNDIGKLKCEYEGKHRMKNQKLNTVSSEFIQEYKLRLHISSSELYMKINCEWVW